MHRSFLKGGTYSYRPENGHRSGLEDTIATQIADYEEEVYEQSYLKYTIPESNHQYTPDFILSNGIIIEAKGLFTTEDRQKHLYVKKQYPHLDIRFVFQNANNKIYKGSKTTYAKWCEKNGFKYASKLIPSAWFLESKKDTTGLLKKKKKGDKND